MSHETQHYRPGTHPRGEDTRRRLVETATEIFAIHGYEGATTRMLAERAGVNLPAIQYYFGSKEGLYRAVSEHIIEHIERHMSATAERVRAALAGPAPPRREVLRLLDAVLDVFAAMVLGEQHSESRKLFIARAEVERMAAIEPLHESMLQQVLRPTAALVARLAGRPADDEQVLLRTIMLLGQVTIFCNKPSRRALGSSEFSAEQVGRVQALMREHTAAIFRSAKGAKP
ncbi:MAG: CerR family C-terminal domain-containing protein [Alphaproteobacteria bacterium]